MIRFMGLFTLIPITLLLTLGFFVNFAASKTEDSMLKSFSKVLSWLIHICAILIAIVGLFIIITGRHPLMMMMERMHERGGWMMREEMMKGEQEGCGMNKMESKEMKKGETMPVKKEMKSMMQK